MLRSSRAVVHEKYNLLAVFDVAGFRVVWLMTAIPSASLSRRGAFGRCQLGARFIF